MSYKIYAIRHGVTQFNEKNIINGHIDDNLSAKGIEQAEKASFGVPKTIKRIYSSSLLRARQTAEILNKKLQAYITFHDELKEADFGQLNGTVFLDEYKKIFRSKEQKYDWHSVGGESFEDVKTRVLKILKVIKNENSQDGEVLIVAHGGIIRMLQFLEYGEAVEEVDNATFYSFDLEKILK